LVVVSSRGKNTHHDKADSCEETPLCGKVITIELYAAILVAIFLSTSSFSVSCNIVDDHHLWRSPQHSPVCTETEIVDMLTCACREVRLPAHPLLVFSLVVVPDADMQDFNNRFRQHNKPTNVLAFPNQDKQTLWDSPHSSAGSPLDLGDILLGWHVMRAEAQEQNKTMFHHTMHLIAHGFLHLLHFDHQTDEEAQIMETAEQNIFRNYQWPNPYEDRHLFSSSFH